MTGTPNHEDSERESLTVRNLKQRGYKRYTLSNAALRLVAESGGDLIISKGLSSAPFMIQDTEDADWIDGLTIDHFEPEGGEG